MRISLIVSIAWLAAMIILTITFSFTMNQTHFIGILAIGTVTAVTCGILALILARLVIVKTREIKKSSQTSYTTTHLMAERVRLTLVKK